MSRTPVFGVLVALAVSGSLLGFAANGGDSIPASPALTVVASSAKSAGSADVVSKALIAARIRDASNAKTTPTTPRTPTATRTPATAAPRATAKPAVVRTQRQRVVIALPYATKVTKTASYFEGQSKVVVVGRNGVRIKVIRIVRVNGQVVRRVLVSSRVTKAPRNKVVLVGIRLHPVSQAWRGGSNVGRSSVDNLNWHALAMCESRARATAGGHTGPYYGMYQFTKGAWKSVGGRGYPSDASASEQTYRAKLLFIKRGAGPWPSCGRRL